MFDVAFLSGFFVMATGYPRDRFSPDPPRALVFSELMLFTSPNVSEDPPTSRDVTQPAFWWGFFT